MLHACCHAVSLHHQVTHVLLHQFVLTQPHPAYLELALELLNAAQCCQVPHLAAEVTHCCQALAVKVQQEMAHRLGTEHAVTCGRDAGVHGEVNR